MVMLTAQSLLKELPAAFPVELELGGTQYQILSVLRFLAGRRIVLHASNESGEFVLKIFAAQGKGQQEYQRELKAHQHCTQADISVAPILQHADDQQGICFIVYAFLPKAVTLNELSEDAFPLIALFDLFGRCHQNQCYQQDPHLDNFVFSNNILYLLDLASVVCPKKRLKMATCLNNLARLMAQFPLEQQEWMLDGLPAYFAARNMPLDPIVEQQLLGKIKKARDYRQTHYLKKQFRSCTMTRYRKSLMLEAAWRGNLSTALAEQPLTVLNKAMQDGIALKKGNSATVVKSELLGQPVVIKRYNMKTPWHFLRRCLRKSRANVSWYNANLLEFLGIATPQPFGFVEQRFLGLRQKAYFICEHIVGRSLADLSDSEIQQPEMLQQISDLFEQLHLHHIYHGDLKATNWLVDNQQKIWLIDLDAMQQITKAGFKRLHKEDQQRFLRNWPVGETRHLLTKAIKA
ncbi:3-deoxy-D-manno-octulosonic-acid kinase [Methylophaga muralis]|uniref:3-deoxy-D-manno-octulosonic-acid kinase n=2 Tax=Methylophaga muralis TaxID=291169 RepID=A0A1E3GNG3_9GAMM|nr:3-deoxy-D-manno-octulosonic-acid kinase [Methylophaga muralis]